MVVDRIEWNNSAMWIATRCSGVEDTSEIQYNQYGPAENQNRAIEGSPWARERSAPY